MERLVINSVEKRKSSLKPLETEAKSYFFQRRNKDVFIDAQNTCYTIKKNEILLINKSFN